MLWHTLQQAFLLLTWCSTQQLVPSSSSEGVRSCLSARCTNVSLFAVMHELHKYFLEVWTEPEFPKLARLRPPEFPPPPHPTSDAVSHLCLLCIASCFVFDDRAPIGRRLMRTRCWLEAPLPRSPGPALSHQTATTRSRAGQCGRVAVRWALRRAPSMASASVRGATGGCSTNAAPSAPSHDARLCLSTLT